MASQAVAGVGTIFRRWSGAAWVAISEITNIDGPSPKRDVTDVTSLDSTGGYKEFIGAFREGGDVKLSMHFIRSGYETMKNDFESDVLTEYEIDMPDVENTVIQFSGFVMEYPLKIAKDLITYEVTIKISGKPDIDSGPSTGLGH